jgi:glycine/D-amino acid oxidase-like deaminating enzyme
MTANNMTTEILIIGGGITGISTAYFLTQAGHEVILLKRSNLASEASGLNAGTLWQIGWGISPKLSTTLSMGGLEIFKMLQFNQGNDIEFRQSGALKAIQTEEELEFLQYENLYIVTGLGSSGFEQGPMSGKLVSDSIHSGHASPILSSANLIRQVTYRA